MTGAFLEADRRRQERFNEEAWWIGLYIYDAVGRLAPIFRFGEKNPKAKPYPSEPYDMTPKHEQPKEVQDKLAENERLKAIWFFKKWAKDTAKRFHE